LPWEEDLPRVIAAFDPFQDHRAQLYCEGIAQIELMRQSKGFNIENEAIGRTISEPAPDAPWLAAVSVRDRGGQGCTK
jgi:hypothetical protein